ncbi:MULTISPECIES: MmgE/PrpD family protein [unclassified Halomonas]|uniref:MmgE/PrpD family protein n=1 Tax=unclassified Halomonas TaxID=2609666 RepID=UPI00099042C1|nr:MULTISPECIES: MmgE/PrpD family protein [unclassified Halomonas]AQU81881.1 hypothetical protein B2G49_04265 [Halomonas sp. 'Soap Lake \
MEHVSKEVLCKYFIFQGAVQGVGFRKWVKRKAIALGINGWVSNLENDKVQGYFQGDEDNIVKLLNSCAAGPSLSNVSAIYTSVVCDLTFQNFSIKKNSHFPEHELDLLEPYGDIDRAAAFSLFPAKLKRGQRKEIFRYVRAVDYSDLSKIDIERSKLLILDAIGLICLASTDPRMDSVRKIGLELSGNLEEVSVLGLERKVSAPAAAFINAAYMQLHDFNDGHREATALGGDPHPGRSLVPSALVEAGLLKVSGKDLITAVAIGYDVASKIRGRRDLKPKHPEYASAAVSAKLRNFSTNMISNALGYAGYLSASLYGKRASGFHSNVLSKGFQAYNGLIAARVAEAGQQGPNIEFDSTRTLPFLLSEAGSGFEVSKVYIKPYPTCRMTHSPIAALEHAMNSLDVGHTEIESILVKQLPAGMYIAKKKPRPGINYKQAQFNLFYCLARYAFDRKMGVEQFSEEKCSEKALFEFIEKIEVVKDAALSKGYPLKKRSASVEIKTYDGRSFACQVDLAPGSAEDLEESLVAEKFYKNCDGVISSDNAKNLYDMVMSIEEIEDVSLFSEKMKDAL